MQREMLRRSAIFGAGLRANEAEKNSAAGAVAAAAVLGHQNVLEGYFLQVRRKFKGGKGQSILVDTGFRRWGDAVGRSDDEVVPFAPQRQSAFPRQSRAARCVVAA